MTMPVSVSLGDVRKYLESCNKDTIYKIVGILQHTLTLCKNARGEDQSASYVIAECTKVDPNSPLVKLLKKSEKAWPQVMTISDEIAKERGLDIKLLYG